MSTRVVILGAGGRDFHNFNVYFRDKPQYTVVAFTATQIPDLAGRIYPPELAGRYHPSGIPIVLEEELDTYLHTHQIDQVVFAYSDVSYEHVMHLSARALAGGAGFRILGPGETMLQSTLQVISVGATRTGSGKSQTTRRIASVLRDMNKQPVVIRHPMAYGEDLAAQAVQRFATLEDLDRSQITIEEREEFEPHIAAGTVVFAGVDYEPVLRQAEREADILVWDGGNNDFPFIQPDLHIVVTDPHRPGHELRYHPGEANLRMAHVVLINKVDTAVPESVEIVRRNVAGANPHAIIIDTGSPMKVDDPSKLRGRRAIVVEDGPTVTHGEMSHGAGLLAAERHGAVIVDPRPYAVGSIKKIYAAYPHLARVLPAMGYGDEQRRELEETLNRADADVVVIGTPFDLRRVIKLNKPAVRVTYELEERGRPTLADVIRNWMEGRSLGWVGGR